MNRQFEVQVSTDNKNSYNLCLQEKNNIFNTKYGKSIVLVRCVRECPEDNERGYKLATKIANFLNALSQDELVGLVQDEALPPIR